MHLPTRSRARHGVLAATLLTLVVLAAALPHPDPATTRADLATSLAAGLTHPLGGADHLLAMLGVGAWSLLRARSANEVLRLPLVFAALLLTGAGLGLSGVALPLVEPTIAASLVAIGLLVASRGPLPGWAGMAVVGGFAVFHGHAHGVALPTAAASTAYLLGLTVTTVVLQIAGVGLGAALRRQARWTGLAGVAIAAYGVTLLLP